MTEKRDYQHSKEPIQLLNTAIIKSKEKGINSAFDERLFAICNRPEINAISVAINTLAEEESISRDQAAIRIVETFRELDAIWNDYVCVEGLTSFKEMLKGGPPKY